jgi:hypothetical protein
MTPDHYSQLEAISRRSLRMYDLTDREKRVCELIIEYSFGRGREAAVIRSLDTIVELTGIDRGDVSRTLRGLRLERKVVQRRGPRDAREYAFLPFARYWRETKPLFCLERALVRAAELDRDNGQMKFGTAVEQPDLEDGLAMASRDAALDGGPSRTGVEIGGLPICERSQIGESPTPDWRITNDGVGGKDRLTSGARTRAGDVLQNVNTQNVLQNVTVGELPTPAGAGGKRFANDQKNYALDLVETLSTKHPWDRTDWLRNRFNWIRRLRDHDERIVIRAAGNVKEQEQTAGNKREKPIGAVLFKECQKVARQLGQNFHLW